MTILKPDICVIGAGSAGLSVAAACGLFGVPTVLIERARMGGECLNAGCVPSKALIAAGRHVAAIRAAREFGIVAGEPQVDWRAVRAHVRGVIGAIAPNDSVERFTALGVQVLSGEARFTGPRTVVVGETVIEARRVVIATGSRPLVPPIPGLAELPYLTNESLFEIEDVPSHLLVLGGGPIGIEMAQAHRRLGCAVTLVEAGRILPREDAEIAAVVRRALLREGVVLYEGARVTAAQAGADGGIVLDLDGARHGPVAGSHLLVATGRRPALEGLGLDAAGIAADETGIVVDKGLRTANRRVYAIGDCVAGAPRFTHVANDHAGLVLRSALFRTPVSTIGRVVPRVTYCDPEVASVGASEEEAIAREKGVRILRWPFGENDRAQAERRTEGLIKVVVAKDGRVLGATIVGAGAGDLLAPWTGLVARKAKLAEAAGLIVPYPTLGEVTRRVAVSDLMPMASKPWVRRALALLRRLG